MAVRRFEFSEGGSSKFWEIDLEGTTVTVRFGKIGSKGQTKPKTLDDEDAAKKEYDKLIKEKTKKGYEEVDEVAAPARAPAPAPAPAVVAAAAAPAETKEKETKETKEKAPAKPKGKGKGKAEDAPVADAPAPAPVAPAPPPPAPAPVPAGKRRFEFEDDESSKFWEIDLEGKTITVSFGKIGSKGQTKPKEHPDEATARKEYDKLIKEKTKKGYEEVTD